MCVVLLTFYHILLHSSIDIIIIIMMNNNINTVVVIIKLNILPRIIIIIITTTTTYYYFHHLFFGPSTTSAACFKANPRVLVAFLLATYPNGRFTDGQHCASFAIFSSIAETMRKGDPCRPKAPQYPLHDAARRLRRDPANSTIRPVHLC